MIRLIFIVTLLTIIPTIGLCEIYKWRNDNGTLEFTDDISRVPEKYRNQIKSIPALTTPSSNQIKPEQSPDEIKDNDSDQSPSIDISPGSPLDTLLRNKWKMMITALKRNETKKALDLIHPKKRSDYKEMFEVLHSQLPFIVSTQIDFRFKNNYDSHSVQYELTTNEKGTTYSYEVHFQQDTNGVWWIYDF